MTVLHIVGQVSKSCVLLQGFSGGNEGPKALLESALLCDCLAKMYRCRNQAVRLSAGNWIFLADCNASCLQGIDAGTTWCIPSAVVIAGTGSKMTDVLWVRTAAVSFFFFTWV